MANIRLIKRRIKSAKNISQITKAMELVAASKMRKAQTQALAGKLYANKIYEMVMRLAGRPEKLEHPLLVKPHLTGKRIIILVTTNKGLCGGLNTTLLRTFLRQYEGQKQNTYLTLGRKGAEFAAFLGFNVAADFSATVPFVANVPALTDYITREFISGKFDGVDILSNEFINILKQAPRKRTILPLTIAAAAQAQETQAQESCAVDFLIEPNSREVFELLLPHYLENQIRDVLLQAEASEHAARMIAMRNATDNALAFMAELTLLYNKARQEKITYEISDMVTARLAVE